VIALVGATGEGVPEVFEGFLVETKSRAANLFIQYGSMVVKQTVAGFLFINLLAPV